MDAEIFYRRELPLVERLAQDSPNRPEHGRELAHDGTLETSSPETVTVVPKLPSSGRS